MMKWKRSITGMNPNLGKQTMSRHRVQVQNNNWMIHTQPTISWMMTWDLATFIPNEVAQVQVVPTESGAESESETQAEAEGRTQRVRRCPDHCWDWGFNSIQISDIIITLHARLKVLERGTGEQKDRIHPNRVKPYFLVKARCLKVDFKFCRTQEGWTDFVLFVVN